MSDSNMFAMLSMFTFGYFISSMEHAKNMSDMIGIGISGALFVLFILLWQLSWYYEKKVIK